MRRHRRTAGYTLVELMMTVLVISVLVTLLLPSTTTSAADRAEAAARFVVSDLAYARSLAMSNNSTYRLTFDVANNLYYLEHSGANAALNTLPSSAFGLPTDPATRQTTNLSLLPSVAGAVRLSAVGSNGNAPAPRTQLEFGPYGQTTQVDETAIWLTAGAADAQRYIWVRVNPVTGLATVEDLQTGAPPAALTAGGS